MRTFLARIASCFVLGLSATQALAIGSSGTRYPAPPRLVQFKANGYSAPTSTSAVLAKNEQAGNLLVAAIYWDYYSAVTVSDTAGNTWTPLSVYGGTAVSGNGFNGVPYIQIWYAQNIKMGANTVTASEIGTGSGSFNDGIGMYLLEYSGVRGNAFDVSVGQHTAVAANTMTTNSVTSNGYDLMVALFMDPCGSGTMVGGPGFTTRATDPNYYSLVEDNAPAGFNPGSISATATLPSGANDNCWQAAGAAFRVK